jgi:hypothetical protein
MTPTFPAHPYTRLTAIGFRRDGTPIWPIMGGAEEPEPPGEDTEAQALLADAVDPPADKPAEPAAQPKANKPEDALGDAGKRALAAEREARKAEADARKAAEKANADLVAQLDGLKPITDLFAQIRKTAVPDAEKTDVEKLAERLAAQEKATADERLARWRVEVAAEKGLTKAQAARLQGGTFEELAADADDLLALFPKPAPAEPKAEATPAEPAKPPTPKPDPSQGPRGESRTRSPNLAAAVQAAMTQRR